MNVLDLDIFSEHWGRMDDNYRKTELKYFVNNILTALGEDERNPYSPSGYVHPDDEYGCVEITDDLMFLIEFETATVLRFGLFKRREIGQLPQAVFTTFIGLPSEGDLGYWPALRKLTRQRALKEVFECIQRNLSEKDFPESWEIYAKRLKSRSGVSVMEVDKYFDSVEKKLNRSEPRIGAVLLGLLLYTAFLAWVWNR